MTAGGLAPRQHAYTAPPLVIALCLDASRYVAAECQLEAHHACPGGMRLGRVQGVVERLYCQCSARGCMCRKRAASRSAEQDPDGTSGT